MRQRIPDARLAVLLVVVALAGGIPACSDGRSGFNPPSFVTFNPTTGIVYTIQATPLDSPILRSDLELGLGREGWNLTEVGRFGLVFDSELGELIQVDFSNLQNAREVANFFNVASFRIDGVEFSPPGTLAILREGNFTTFKLLDYVLPDSPVLSGDLTLEDTVDTLEFPFDGRFGVFTFSDRFDRVVILDPSLLGDPLVTYDLATQNQLLDLTFLDLVPDHFAAIEATAGTLRTYRFDDRTSTISLEAGSIDVGDPTLTFLSTFFRRAAVAAGGTTGELFLIDVEVPTNPILISRVPLSTPVDDYFLAVSPDDRFVAVGDRPSGRVQVFNIELPEAPLQIASFDLGSPLTAMQFSSVDDDRTFTTAPSLLAVTGSTLRSVDLSDSIRPFLGAGIAFGLSEFDTFRMRNRVILTGLDSNGRVVTYDVTEPDELESIGSFDLGVGSGTSATELVQP